jgi:hypothetical protein
MCCPPLPELGVVSTVGPQLIGCVEARSTYQPGFQLTKVDQAAHIGCGTAQEESGLIGRQQDVPLFVTYRHAALYGGEGGPGRSIMGFTSCLAQPALVTHHTICTIT